MFRDCVRLSSPSPSPWKTWERRMALVEGALRPQSCTARARLAPSNSIMMSKYMKIYILVVLTYLSQIMMSKYIKIYTFVVLTYLSQTEKNCLMDGFRPTFTSLIFRVNCKIVMTMTCNHLEDDILWAYLLSFWVLPCWKQNPSSQSESGVSALQLRCRWWMWQILLNCVTR